jgi:hypothetical protein
VSDRYDPALGFVSRTGVGNMHLVNTYNLRSDTRWLRLTQLFIESDHTTDLDFKLLDHTIWVGSYFENKYGDNLNIWVNDAAETYDAPFAIRPGIVIPVGEHQWNAAQVQIGTARARPVDVYVRWRHGGFLTGHADDYQATVGWRPSSKLQLSVNGSLRDIRLPQGDFQVRLASAKVVYTFSPDVQVSLIGQYDNLSAQLGVNFRLKWIVQPGNEVFFIVNQGYDTSLDRFRPTQNDTSMKAAWTFRF